MAKLTLKELEQRNSDLQVTVDQQAQQLQEIQQQAKQEIESVQAELIRTKSDALDQIVEKGQENKQLKTAMQNINNQLVQLAQLVGVKAGHDGAIQMQAFAEAIQGLAAAQANA